MKKIVLLEGWKMDWDDPVFPFVPPKMNFLSWSLSLPPSPPHKTENLKPCLKLWNIERAFMFSEASWTVSGQAVSIILCL